MIPNFLKIRPGKNLLGAGFTLIEIMIVIAIIIIITNAGISIYSSSRKYMAVDLESDKIVANLQSFREESKVLNPPRCVGVKFAKEQKPQKVFYDYDSERRECKQTETIFQIAWPDEVLIPEISLSGSPANQFVARFAPPFGETEFVSDTRLPADSAEITVSFKNNPQVFKKVYINRITGRIEKI